VVQLVGGARQRRCGSFARPYRTAHDPRADSRSAEARERVEVKYAVAFSLERLTATWLKKLASLARNHHNRIWQSADKLGATPTDGHDLNESDEAILACDVSERR